MINIHLSYYNIAEQLSNKTVITKKSAIPQVVEQSHEIKLKQNPQQLQRQLKKRNSTTEKHEITKKYLLTRPINYQNNLDGLTGKLHTYSTRYNE